MIAEDNSTSIFDVIEIAHTDNVNEIFDLYKNCKNPDKINLILNSYLNEKLEPFVFESVNLAEKEIIDEGFSREYLPFTGDEEYNLLTQKTLFNPKDPFINENKFLNIIEEKRILSLQSISGIGCLRIAAEFLKKFVNNVIYIPKIIYFDKSQIFSSVGMNVKEYSLKNPNTKEIDFNLFLNFLEKAEENSILFLNSCDFISIDLILNGEKIKQICDLFKKKNLFAFFDLANQTYYSGNISEDYYLIYEFLRNGLEMFISQSFSKLMGIYGERASSLHIIVNEKELIPNIKVQFADLAKGLYLVPVGHGARIVKKVLSDENLKKLWVEENKSLTKRMNYLRMKLYEEFIKEIPQENWENLKNEKGMYCYLGINEIQSKILIEKYNIFVFNNGIISLCGLTEEAIPKLALAIKDIIKK